MTRAMPKSKRAPRGGKAADRPLVRFEVINGAEGPSLYMNDYRICGPKPWGGGMVAYSFTEYQDAFLEYVADHFDVEIKTRESTRHKPREAQENP